ncbi:MAG: diguanylate cyclase, partial [Betaproteobacteria bacterium]
MDELAGAREKAAATRALALLNEQVGAARAELAVLRRDLLEVREESGNAKPVDLRDVNERLVVAAMHAEIKAETATNDLAELTHSSQRDFLTDMPNRAQMQDRLEKAIVAAERSDTRLAVLFIDLDEFKSINDTLGHAVGDEVLQLVARRLLSVVRHTDIVSRFGGDEFVVLLPAISQTADAGAIAAKITAVLSAPARLESHDVNLSASVGIAMYPEDGEDATALISRADRAMYRSKRQAHGNFTFYADLEARDGNFPPPAAQAKRRADSDPPTLPDEQAALLGGLLEANERLIISALDAQEVGARAAEVHLNQIKFMAMVAHELRDPLAPIRIAAELINRRGTDERLLVQAQAVIKRQVNHMSRLVEDLLDGSRASMGKFRLKKDDVDIVGILRNSVDTCMPDMRMRLQSLKSQLPGSPLNLHGDAVRLTQIFVNLLENASKYTQECGEISISVVAQDESIAITIADNGFGIPPETLPHVFDLFVQEPGARTHREGGLGIGLAVVRELVEAHGGTVAARSAGKGQGSEFVVTLPIA